jgi:sugar O-acyltransferase, sialic acid O-acetyltransferase NeuD family
MKPLLIFGCGQIAELAHFYFSEQGRSVAAFVVDAEFRTANEFRGVPVIDYDRVTEVHPPDDFDAFVALSYSKVNRVRAQKVEAMRTLGYDLASYISPRATFLAADPPGENCFILEDNTIQPFVKIGRNVTLWSGNHIGHHSVIEDHAFISSHVVVSGGVRIGAYSFLGVNSTLRNGISLGESTVVGAGALINADTPPSSVFFAQAAELSRVPSHRLRGL